MNSEQVLGRLRRFLFGLAILMFAGSLAELFLINHLESFTQLIPFILSGVGIVLAVWVSLQPSRLALQLLRPGMILIALGSAFGIYIHVASNLAFEMEIRPNVTAGEVFFEALGGVNPLLAPGIIGLAAVVALAGAYQHPAAS